MPINVLVLFLSIKEKYGTHLKSPLLIAFASQREIFLSLSLSLHYFKFFIYFITLNSAFLVLSIFFAFSKSLFIKSKFFNN